MVMHFVPGSAHSYAPQDPEARGRDGFDLSRSLQFPVESGQPDLITVTVEAGNTVERHEVGRSGDDRLSRIVDAVQNYVDVMYSERDHTEVEDGGSPPALAAVVVAYESQIMTKEGDVAYQISYTHPLGSMSSAPGLLAHVLHQVNKDQYHFHCDGSDD